MSPENAERRPLGEDGETSAKKSRPSIPPEGTGAQDNAPRGGRVYVVTSWRPNARGPERVTRLRYRRPAAERYAARQAEMGRAPVEVWQARLDVEGVAR